MNRRDALKSLAVLSTLGLTSAQLDAFAQTAKYGLKQSACLWCYNGYLKKNNLSLDDFCKVCAEIGLQSLELTGPGEWGVMKKHGLMCAMLSSPGIARGFNHVENHDFLVDFTRKQIDLAVEWGFPNVICMSGNCEGMGKEEGLANCVTGLKRILPYAEEKKIVLCMEFLNSHGHKDYMADSTAFCVELTHTLDSPSFRILYDIFHAAMMGEDPIQDIREHSDCWGHYHTGGYPGRAEIDLDSQTLDYRVIMEEIAKTGFKGYIGQEFCPRRDAIQSLREAYALCDI